MRLKELDTQLDALQSQLQCATDNIIELSELPLCKQLREELASSPAKLAGLTRDCVCAALTEIDETLQYILLIKPTLERALTVRQTMWMTQESKTHELEQLLTGASVQLPPLETPLLGRTLTGPAELPQQTSIGELQSRMAKNFDSAKRTIQALHAAREHNAQRLTRIGEELSALEAQARNMCPDEQPWAKELREDCAALTGWLETDPLHVSETLNRKIDPALAHARKLVRELSDEREAVSRQLVRAVELVKKLEALQARATALHAESAAKIQNCATLRAPISPERIAELRAWLATLQQRMPGEWQHVRAALRKWTVELERALALERVAIAANARPLELYAELRERFAALRERARNETQNENLRQLGAAAEKILRARPVQLELGAKLVHAYALAISGAGLSARTNRVAKQRK